MSAGKRVPCTNHTRYYNGHCNVDTTKDVNFYGLQDEYVVSGSDCGNFFIWEKKTGRIVNILEGDREIVNVIQPHPYEPMLAVSGIDSTVKIFSADARARADAAGARCGVRAIDPSGFSSVRVHRRAWGVTMVDVTDTDGEPEDTDGDEDGGEIWSQAHAAAVAAAQGYGAFLENGGEGGAVAEQRRRGRAGGDEEDGDEEAVAPDGLASRKKLHDEYRITVRNDMNRRAGKQLHLSRDMLSTIMGRLGDAMAEHMDSEDAENCYIM
jgi:nuclear receptor interaction protein